MEWINIEDQLKWKDGHNISLYHISLGAILRWGS